MNEDIEAQIKAAIKSHRVTFTVSWELTPDEFGTDKYFNDELAHLHVNERMNSGLPVTVQFMEDTHDFGEGNVASISRAVIPPPWETLRDIADYLESESSEEGYGCEP